MMREMRSLLSLALILAACGGDDGGGDGGGDDAGGALGGTFSIGGTINDCRTETQDFSTGEFSVICQNDDTGLVQITFKDEASARLAQSLTITYRDIFEHPDPASVDVGYRSFTGEDAASDNDAPGTAVATVTGSTNVVTLTNVQLSNAVSDVQAVVSATVEY